MTEHLTRSRPAILLTGFGPFPGVPENASSKLVTALAPAAARAFPGHAVHPELLATEWHGGTRRVVELLEAYRPVLALHFGVSSRATGFVIECRGYNERSATADACGHTPEQDCLIGDGPEMLASRLPVNLIAHRLRVLGLPVEISRDAGRYLCNAALYHSLDTVRRRNWTSRAGFIHLPIELHDRQHVRGSKLTLPQAIAGGLEIIGACIRRPIAAQTRGDVASVT